MIATALGHRIETLNEGATCFLDGDGRPMPLTDTEIDVQISCGLATITTTRTFRNAEEVPIEVVLTMPVGFDAVVTGLSASIGERTFEAQAKAKTTAREVYENAIDDGRLAVLHEEALRGVHILSVGSLPAGEEVSVTLEAVAPLTNLDGVPFLRIPVTVGHLYGTSPLLPADDLAVSAHVRHEATLTVTADEGAVRLIGNSDLPIRGLRIPLDRAIELSVEGGVFGQHQGVTADGRGVQISLSLLERNDAPLALSILVDRSGSTGAAVNSSGSTVFSAMKSALVRELGIIGDNDRIDLWQFDSTCENVGEASGARAADLARSLESPRGGTELGAAVKKVLASGARHILVLTDGMTHATLVEDLKASEARVSAILVGAGSLDAHIGHVCAMTGGQVFFARGDDVSPALKTALESMRRPGGYVTGEVDDDRVALLSATRGGVEIRAEWGDRVETVTANPPGRYAAALAVPLLRKAAAQKWAEANGLCSHLTSLILTDTEINEDSRPPEMRKVPLMGFAGDARAMSIPMAAPHLSILAARTPSIDAYSSESFATTKFRRAERPSLSRAPRKLVQGSPLRIGESPKKEDVERLAASIDWAHLGRSLSVGDFSRLDRHSRDLIERLAEAPEVKRVANQHKISALLVAIGVIASRAGLDRYARRVARNISAVISFDEIASQLSFTT
ncbi:VIT domain-containing protein [Tropicimonas sp. IMCC6043]|uniref:VIT domain-containing protein n=1 Tax=Tropicimonas sp. IMCC6043 TaxID=2510645 RepID=UPI00101BE433|nr:VIT domain-containing protein [Tropicimonas sp. IMCC6043]RYH07617.1 hypothetical protein EU800_19645 [Tropicimonas sp. IMCC6043]